jgi:hypothetical protein
MYLVILLLLNLSYADIICILQLTSQVSSLFQFFFRADLLKTYSHTCIGVPEPLSFT